MKLKEKNGMYLAYNDEFSEIKIRVLSKVNFNKKTGLISNILSNYISKTNTVYKTKKEICDKCDELYSLELGGGLTFIYNSVFYFLDISLIDEKVLNVKYFDDAIEFIKDIVFNIRIENNKLDKKTIDEIKKDLINKKRNSLANPRYRSMIHFSKNNFIDYKYTQNTITNIDEFIELIDSITDQDIIDFYNEVINSFYRGYVFGNVSDKEFDKINNLFTGPRNTKIIKYDTNIKLNDKDIEIGDDETTQSLLINTYYIDDNDSNYVVYNVLDSMIDSMEGLLMELLRTKYGIVYSASTDISYNLKYLTIECDIDKKNKQKCLDAIDEMFEMLHDKTILQRQLDIAKKKYNETFETYTENKGSVIMEVDKKVFEKRISREEEIELINKITIDDILKILPNIKKVNTYFYRGDKNE